MAKNAKPMFQSVSDQVFFYLKEKIINNELVPGSVLSIDRLSSEFGISNTPVREAVVRLESLDLVTVNRNRNITVSAMSRDKILDILEMRRLLETYGSRTAALNITDGEIESLEKVLDGVLANPADLPPRHGAGTLPASRNAAPAARMKRRRKGQYREGIPFPAKVSFHPDPTASPLDHALAASSERVPRTITEKASRYKDHPENSSPSPGTFREERKRESL